MFDPASVRFRGPLKAHVGGFWRELLRLRYSPLSAGNLLRVAAHFSRWLEDRSLAAGDISDERAVAFMVRRRAEGYTQFLSPRALGPLVGYLRGIGITPPSAPTIIASPVDQLLFDYAGYLARERGLVGSTIRGYTDFARRFIAQRPAGVRLKWGQLKPAYIIGFVLREARRWGVGRAKLQVTQLRSLLRYLHAEGHIRRDLACCVPAVAGWRLAGIPKGLETDQVRQMLEVCDSRSPIGRRDAAMVCLMVRLGLRAGDVAALMLDDLDWRAGEITLRGKGRRESRLPLPHDVGRALAAYLRARGASTDDRRVFLRSRAPYTPLTTGGVNGAVRGVLRRSGIAGGTHRLRHTAATQMLRHGASLPEIGHVLRHRHMDTTAIYAKVDFASLRTLAQPWPGGDL
ncbi:MAG TPA: site-specific integrase [Kofleriaceae bacterium]|nr:site-specific integrase [Kofleriaceae bacterium]